MKLIKTATDSHGEKMQIFWQDNLNMCPALSLFLKVYAETIDMGHANPMMIWNNKNRIIWAEKQGKVVGGICYEYVSESKMGWVILSFTDTEQRGRHINEALRPIMEEDVRRSGGDRICSLIHVDNVSSMKSCERVGMKVQFHRMYKQI